MLGREQLHEIDARVACLLAPQQIDVRVSFFVDSRLIGEKADALSANEMYAVRQENRDARSHPGFGKLRCGIDLLVYHYAAADRCQYREQPNVSHHRDLS